MSSTPVIDPRGTRSNTNKQAKKKDTTTTLNTSTPTTIEHHTKLETAMENLLSSNNNITSKINEISRELSDVKLAMDFMSSKYDDMKKMLEKISIDHKNLQTENENLKRKFDDISLENKQIKTDIQSLQQQNIKNNVVVFGIPNINDNTNLKTTLNKIIFALNITPSDIKIDDIYKKKPTRTLHQ